MSNWIRGACVLAVTLCTAAPAAADENLFGRVKGAETLPEGSWEIYQILNSRRDKGVGDYKALDGKTELEYGLTDRVSVSAAIKTMSLDTSGIRIDGYLPEDKDFGLKLAGAEASIKYNFLSPAMSPLGLSGYWALDYMSIDPHSGQDKKTVSLESLLIAQRYFLEGQLVWVGNLGFEATYAKRDAIAGLPDDFEWPTEPEMEQELQLGTGLTYRFAPGWFLGLEALYETEFETEVGQERWSVFLGPNLHYAARSWWATFSWLEQLDGGGELIDPGDDLHLIEKTKHEYVLKLGFNF